MTTRRNFFKSAAAGLTALVAAPFVMKALPKAAPLNPVFYDDKITIDQVTRSMRTNFSAMSDAQKKIWSDSIWASARMDELAFKTLSGMC